LPRLEPGSFIWSWGEATAHGGDHTEMATMGEAARRVTIRVGLVSVEAELKSNKTATAIYEALPVESTFNVWGEEFYFKLPGIKDHRETATTHVKVGDVAFWGAGEVVAIFFGRTPMSVGPDPVPADRVNVIGRITGDATVLRQAVGATKIRIERAEGGDR
jgi:hypothetical protein